MAKAKPVSFWNPMKANARKSSMKTVSFFPAKTKSKSTGLKVVSFIRPPSPGMKKRNMTWDQAKIKYPGLKPYADSDRDGVPNIMDCRPFNNKKHIVLKYSRATPEKVKKAVTSYFEKNPELKEAGEQFGSKKIFWKFGEDVGGRVPSKFGKRKGIVNASFIEEEKVPPQVNISSQLEPEEYPKRIKQALEFKRQVEEKRMAKIMSKPIKENVLQDTIEGRESAPPRLLKGRYAEDVFENLKRTDSEKREIAEAMRAPRGHVPKREHYNSTTHVDTIIEDVEKQAPAEDVYEEMIEKDKSEENY